MLLFFSFKNFFVRFQCELFIFCVFFSAIRKGSSGNRVCVWNKNSSKILFSFQCEIWIFALVVFCTVSFMFNCDGIFALLYCLCGNYWLWFMKDFFFIILRGFCFHFTKTCFWMVFLLEELGIFRTKNWENFNEKIKVRISIKLPTRKTTTLGYLIEKVFPFMDFATYNIKR